MSRAKTAILVLGMHRSGTSVLARTICALGAGAPADEMPPQPDNPEGFCEPLSVVRLNNRLLKVCGSSWDDAREYAMEPDVPDAQARIDSWVLACHGADMQEALATSFPGQELICVKDPRISLLAGAWRSALEQAGYTARLVLIYRHPLSVARSLQKRNGVHLQKGLRLWCKYTLRALSSILEDDATVVRFEDLIAAPGQTVARLAHEISELSAGAQQQAERLVDAGRNHHPVADDDWQSSPMAAGYVRELLKLLDGWTGCSVAERAAVLKELERRFWDMCVLFCQARRLPRAIRSA